MNEQDLQAQDRYKHGTSKYSYPPFSGCRNKADDDVFSKGFAINLDEIKRFEVTEVYTCPDAKVDIVLIHGLNGDPRKTWTAKNGVFWPTDLLPTSLKSAKARILVYGYNADVYAFGGGKSARSVVVLKWFILDDC
jgi:hypothetical protein